MGISLEERIQSKENEKFMAFFKLVQEKAEEQGQLFFVNSGEGNQFETSEFEMEDLSGWLIPEEEVQEFLPKWRERNNVDHLLKWQDCFAFAEWKITNTRVEIAFN